MPEHISTGTPDEATHDMVAEITARVVAAMRQETGASTQPVAAPPLPSAGEVADKARQGAAGVVGAVKEQAVSRLDQQKEHAVEELSGVAQSVRQMGQQLKGGQHGPVVQYAAHLGDSAADHLEQASGYLRDHDVKQLVSEVEGFARREPWLFGGGALLLGLLGARFLKSKPVTEEIPVAATPVTEETPVVATPVVETSVAPPITVATPETPVPDAIIPTPEVVSDQFSTFPGDDAVFDNELAEREEMNEEPVATPLMTDI